MFTFDVQNPDVAVLTLLCFDEDITKSDFIGYSSLPVSCLQSGIRTVGLCDSSGQRERDYKFATLFVRISMEVLPEPAFVKPSIVAAATVSSIFSFGN